MTWATREGYIRKEGTVGDVFNCGRHEYMGTKQCPTCEAEATKIKAPAFEVEGAPDRSPEVERSRGKAAMQRLDGRLAEIRHYQVTFSLYVLVGFALWYAALIGWFWGDTQRANYVFTNSFQFMAVAWCCWFMLPYFLRVEAKQDVSLAMGHDSVDVLDKIDSGMSERLRRVDHLFNELDVLMEQARDNDHPVIKKLEAKADKFLEELRYIRIEIRKGAGQKQELDEALADGERVGALIQGNTVPCPQCNEPMKLVNNGTRDIAFCDVCSGGIEQPR